MCATRFSSMYKMLRSLQQNKQALINTVVLHGFDADERAKRIKSRVLSEAWWALNNCLWTQWPGGAAATERLFSAFKFIWSDRRSRLLLGRMWIMSYVFFNTRVMTRKEHHASAEAQEEWESYMAAQVVLDAPQL
ncbi:hypothetical protein V8C86DRAFT_2704626 [Haematococcus lacustris]